MQTVEAMLSLLLVLSLVPELVPAPAAPPDDTLYRLQLAGDAWRVLYLRGDLQDLGDDSREKLESELHLLGDATALCYFMDGIDMTNCRGGDESHQATASLRRSIVYEGKLRTVMFSLKR